jgi:2-polyprenyl-3-methyl-5-hydroxy-6-metoxy-1,4-benzoquinol methylase
VAEGPQDITAALLADSLVREAAVATVDGRPVAYVVPEASADAAEDDSASVDSWRAVFDDIHEAVGADERPLAETATTGWDDSFTGKPIAAAEMREWVDTTVARITALRPQRVLEIGAGTGLLVRPLVSTGTIETYVATDFTPSSIGVLDQLADELKDSGTRIVVAKADAVDAAAVAGGAYDVVIVNSVVQYFPSLRYLDEVLTAALAVVRPGGHVVLGDLRNHVLVDAFFALKRQLRGDAPDRIRDAIRYERDHDRELSVDPAWLAGTPNRLPGVTHVEIAPRRGESATEMTLFRYDAVLHVGCADVPETVSTQPGSALVLPALERRLARETEPFGFTGVPNARLEEALAARDDHGFTPEGGTSSSGVPVDPEVLADMGERHGWLVRLSWARADRDGAFDVTFLPPGTATHFRIADPAPAGVQTTEVFPPGVATTFAERVRAGLAGRLPADRVPADVVSVTALPRTADGALDVAALPRPRRGGGVEQAAPAVAATSTLELIQEIYSARLGKPCGPDDNFFVLGGESFAAAMCVRDLRERGITVSMRDFFTRNTPRSLADHLA